MNKFIWSVMLAGTTCAVQAADIAVHETSLGKVYTDKESMTLYTFDKDANGMSVCDAECSKNWPPLRVTEKMPPTINGLEAIKREDGTQQWALNGKPLYRWVKDMKPGDTTGAGVKNVWQVARADETPVRVYATTTGRILVNAENMTLYTFDKDQNGIPACYDDCAEKWPPVIVRANAKLTPPFSSTARRDGQQQLRYNNMPLYLWKQDRSPGDTTGDNVKNVWHIISITQ